MSETDLLGYRTQVHYYSKRLRARLNQICDFRTTFVEAPSGAGKTTALQDFFADMDKNVRVRWFVASEEPPTSGWARLCSILNELDPDVGAVLLRLGFPNEENQGEIAQALISLNCDDETYLICDNFQFLQKYLLASVWKALIDHGGDGLRLIVLTQQLSSRGLAVLSNADVLQIRNEDLCLNAKEIGEYYRMAGVELDEEQMQSLYQYSEGWIAALYLQLVSFARTGSFERRGSIYEMVDELFWKPLSREDKIFFLRLSPFDNFTVPQVCFLLGIEFLSEPLAERLNRGAFMRYDTESRRYFPHAIFLDFVRLALSDEPEPLQREILFRAGEWSVSVGEKTQALNFFYRLRDYPAILSMNLRCVDIARTLVDMSRDELLRILRDIVGNASPALRLEHAFTLISIAFEVFTLGDRHLYEQLCTELKELLETCTMEEERRRVLLGELHLAASFGGYNDIAKMGEGHSRAYELLGPNSTLFEPDIPWTFGWPSVLCAYHSKVGEMETELEHMDYYIPRYSALTSGNGSGADVVFRAETLFYRGREAEAEALALKALPVTRHSGQESIYICSAFLIQRIALMRGDVVTFEKGAALIQDSLQRSRHYARCKNLADTAAGFLAVLMNDPDGVVPWLQDSELRSGRLPSPALPFARMLHGRLLLLLDQETELMLRSEEFLATARRYRSVLAEVYVMLCVAAAQYRLGRESEGLDSVCHALALALPDGLILPFAENADLLGPLLPAALKRLRTAEGLNLTLLRDRYAQGREALMRQRLGTAAASAVSLTQRERDIVQMAVEGRSNREISEHLFLSENTVKFHLKSVFQKLDIRSRQDLKKALREHPL